MILRYPVLSILSWLAPQSTAIAHLDIARAQVARLISQQAVQCLVVAPDVERTGGALEDKIAQLVAQCEGQNVRGGGRARACLEHAGRSLPGCSAPVVLEFA